MKTRLVFLGIKVYLQFGKGIFSTNRNGLLSPDGEITVLPTEGDAREDWPYCEAIVSGWLSDQYLGDAYLYKLVD